MSIPTTTQVLASSLVQFASKERPDSVARVTHVAPEKITFEFVTKSPPLEAGDLLADSRILIGGKLAYEGELSVLGVTRAGLLIHIEAQLNGDWISEEAEDADFAERMEADLEAHTIQWAADHDLRPSFLSVVSDLKIYFEGLQSWCNDVERRCLFEHPQSSEREVKLLAKVGPIVSREIESHFAAYEREVAQLGENERLCHREHVMREIHPLFLLSPFNYRCYKKPLGYAGDYGMVQLMMGNPYHGANLMAKLVNNACLETGPVKAHRNRIDYLVDALREVVSQRAEKGLRTRILNLGCGPAEEVRRFIEQEDIAESCDFELLDFSAVTLDYTRGKVAESCAKSGRNVNVKFIEESIQGFLKQAARSDGYLPESYDFVYCAGLFDYLQQRFCAKLTNTLYDLCKPEGLVVVTNVSNHNTIPAVMADLLEWEIIDRSEEEMLELAPEGKSGLLKELRSDVTRINLFLELRKSAALEKNDQTHPTTEKHTSSRARMVGEVRS